MALINLQNITLSFGGLPVLAQLNFQIEPRERVCLIGRNGAGKSTLMKLIDGRIDTDAGKVERNNSLISARLPQQVHASLKGSVYQVVAAGIGEVGHLLAEFHEVSLSLADSTSAATMQRFEDIQQRLEAADGWSMASRVESVLSRLLLSAEADFCALSGGMKRRVLLARALVQMPTLLLLDEPTNHLDIESIAWLEEFLLHFSGALLFVSHDRRFVDRLATRIVELDRGSLTSWPGEYSVYLSRKQAALEAEASQNAEFDKKLAQEEVWIRQGIKARRTRNEGRVRKLEQLREQHSQRRSVEGKARLTLNEAERSGKIVIEAEQVSYSVDKQSIIADFSTTILRGDRIGIIGPNGCGKTTLINLLLGKLEASKGSIRHGTKLEIAYFDQHRAGLRDEQSVQDNVAEGNEQVWIGGQSRHVISYLGDFLFSAQRARSPVSVLSGGERNRLLLAKLFARPSNLLVMDEPTNDLDMETLELLEEMLLEYPGTLLLVSHDREFLDNVITSALVFDQGKLHESVGGYSDWLTSRQTKSPEMSGRLKQRPMNSPEEGVKRAGLGYQQKRELEQLPARIEQLEKQQQGLYAQIAEPEFYQQSAKRMAEVKAELESIGQMLAKCYAHWESLESLI